MKPAGPDLGAGPRGVVRPAVLNSTVTVHKVTVAPLSTSIPAPYPLPPAEEVLLLPCATLFSTKSLDIFKVAPTTSSPPPAATSPLLPMTVL